jgi:hypothetical protein
MHTHFKRDRFEHLVAHLGVKDERGHVTFLNDKECDLLISLIATLKEHEVYRSNFDKSAINYGNLTWEELTDSQRESKRKQDYVDCVIYEGMEKVYWKANKLYNIVSSRA